MPSVAFRTSSPGKHDPERARREVAMPSVAFRTSSGKFKQAVANLARKSQCLRWPFGLRAWSSGIPRTSDGTESQCLRWPFGLRALELALGNDRMQVRKSQCLRWPFGLRGAEEYLHAHANAASRNAFGGLSDFEEFGQAMTLTRITGRNAFGGLSDFESQTSLGRGYLGR